MRCQTFSSLSSLTWSICCVENKREEKAWRPLWTTDPKLRNLSMNGFAVLANKCAEEDANVSKHAVRKCSDRITVHVCKTPCFLTAMSEQKHCQCQRIGDGHRTHGDALSPCCGRNGKRTQRCELVTRATHRVELYSHHPRIPNNKMHRPPNNYYGMHTLTGYTYSKHVCSQYSVADQFVCLCLCTIALEKECCTKMYLL